MDPITTVGVDLTDAITSLEVARDRLLGEAKRIGDLIKEMMRVAAPSAPPEPPADCEAAIRDYLRREHPKVRRQGEVAAGSGVQYDAVKPALERLRAKGSVAFRRPGWVYVQPNGNHPELTNPVNGGGPRTGVGAVAGTGRRFTTGTPSVDQMLRRLKPDCTVEHTGNGHIRVRRGLETVSLAKTPSAGGDRNAEADLRAKGMLA
jgi:hypothetical protein